MIRFFRSRSRGACMLAVMMLSLPLLLASGGCAGRRVSAGTPSSTPSFGEQATLGAGQSALFGNEVRVTFNEVLTDSRCPPGANCVTAGNASVSIRYESPEPPATDIVLYTGTDKPREQAFRTHAVTLLGLKPQPASGTPARKEEYAVTVTVARRK